MKKSWDQIDHALWHTNCNPELTMFILYIWIKEPGLYSRRRIQAELISIGGHCRWAVRLWSSRKRKLELLRTLINCSLILILGPEDSFAIPMHLRHCSPWHGCAYINNTQIQEFICFLKERALLCSSGWPQASHNSCLSSWTIIIFIHGHCLLMVSLIITSCFYFIYPNIKHCRYLLHLLLLVSSTWTNSMHR